MLSDFDYYELLEYIIILKYKMSVTANATWGWFYKHTFNLKSVHTKIVFLKTE